MAFSSIAGLLAAAEGRPLWEAVLEEDLRDRGVERGRSWDKMEGLWRAMREPVEGYDPQRRSPSGLTGGEGALLEGPGAGLCPPFLREVIATALKTGECNACMKRIVAAPTAGSCGVLPAVFLSLEEEKGYPKEQMIKALYVSAGIGGIIAQRASVSGAAGGCQAEIGAASAMAAGGVAFLLGGDGEAIAHAAAMAMKNLLGLACDPVAGLVEVPCVKRNVIGAVNALTSADLANAGIRSRIPPDEVFDAMRNVGRMLPEDLKETGKGGLAATPTGTAFRDNLKTF